ncbi:rhamnan synthesis F family protein [Gulosibacter sp. ACHW.36C]|uniref:Rhamnan synthesis F family protein n=1 Tax=Gulosibacter sediminis TaxID=1729695 RepID=A0ABY4MX88_9MICO|nr:rhamnan synthesis F family protein [Gulosibacter sediminis]UQN14399.1 rhamnan synthesis F family protein [Gulosibacter sediminis]
MRRFVFFLLYDPDGYVDSAVLHTLNGLRPHVEHIMVVSNGFLQAESRERLEAVVDEVFERENVGFDSGAYRSAIGRVGYSKLAEYDEVLLINYTFFGPVTSFDDLFARMDLKPIDFWGMTDHVAVSPHPMLGKGIMPEHLQSYWIAFRKSLVTSVDFREYWASLPNGMSYHDVITVFETALTRHFGDLGYAWESAYPADDYSVNNASMEQPLRLLDDGCPMFKRRLYFHDVVDLDTRDVAASEVTARALELGFPRDVLIDGVIRRTSARALATGLGLLHLVDDAAAPGEPDARLARRTGRVWRSWLRDGIDPFAGAEVLVIDGVTDDELADGPAAEYTNANLDEAQLLRARGGIVDRLADTLGAFDTDARLGVLVPLAEHRASTRLGYGWRGLRTAANRVAEALGLIGPLERHAPLAPLAGVAAYRADAFAGLAERVESAGGWASLVRLAEVEEDELDLIFDLLAADVAKTNGYVASESARRSDFVRSSQLLQYKFADTSARFGPEQRGPFMGPLTHPNSFIRPLVGDWLRTKAPSTAKVVLKGEESARKQAGAAKRAITRIVKKGR